MKNIWIAIAACAVVIFAFGCQPSETGTDTKPSADNPSKTDSTQSTPSTSSDNGATGTTASMMKCDGCQTEMEEAKLAAVHEQKMCEACKGKHMETCEECKKAAAGGATDAPKADGEAGH